jgi:hypothetical protein
MDVQEIKRLTAVLEELRDIEAITQLKARYCYLVDERRWDELAELWTEDAVGDYDFWGIYRGKQEIMQKLFREVFDAAASFFVHMVHNPLIKVRGDSATGDWYLTAQSTTAGSNQAMWVMGRYDDEFQRVGGEWKIKSLKFKFKYFTPYEEGWGKTPMMTLGR